MTRRTRRSPRTKEVSAAEQIIRPTHTCFDDALDLIAKLLSNERDGFARGQLVLELRLVHAQCLAPDGHAYAHAWVEDRKTQRALFCGIVDGARQYLQEPSAEFEARYRMQWSVRYTWPEALRLNHQTGHYGPWVPELRGLCGGTSEWQSTH